MKDFLSIIKASKKEVKQEFGMVCVNSLRIGVKILQKKGLLTQSFSVEVEVEILTNEAKEKRISLRDADVYDGDIQYNGIKILDIVALNKELTRLGLESVNGFEDVDSDSEILKSAVGSHPVVIAYLNSY